MTRKIALLTTFILILLMGSMVFADDLEYISERPSDAVLLESFEVFEPAISDDGSLNVRDHLYISIKINQEYPVKMGLYRIENTLPELEALNEEAIEEPVNVSVIMITPQEDSTTAVELEVPVIHEGTESEESMEIDTSLILDIAESVEEADVVVEELTRVQIINMYFELEAQKNQALSDLIVAEEAYLAAIATLTDTDIDFEKSDVAVAYESSKEAFKKVLEKFEDIAVKYNRLFETPVIEDIALEKTGILPYFKTSVETIEDGDYKLAFTYEEEEEPFKSIEFSVTSFDSMTEDEIATDISEILNGFQDIDQTE